MINVTKKIDRELTGRLENIEKEAWFDLYKAAGEIISGRLGLRTKFFGGALAFAAEKLDVLAFNTILGGGIESGINQSFLKKVKTFYLEAGVRRFFVQSAPSFLDDPAKEILSKNEFYHYNNWTKFVREDEPIEINYIDHEIIEIDENSSSGFGDIIATAFGWQEDLSYWFGNLAGRDNWKCYIAKIDDKPAGAAAMFIQNKTAWLAFGGTLENYRGCGIQKALINKRIEDGIKSGCDLFTVEAAENKPEEPSISALNLEKTGFEIAYLRPNYIFEQ